jgi:hypothetical protein
MPMKLDLPYLAVVPVGGEVLVIPTEASGFFGAWSPATPILVDVGSGVVFGPHWLPLDLDPQSLDLERATRGEYRACADPPAYRARVLRCVVATRGGDHSSIQTRVVIEPLKEPSGYR